MRMWLRPTCTIAHEEHPQPSSRSLNPPCLTPLKRYIIITNQVYRMSNLKAIKSSICAKLPKHPKFQLLIGELDINYYTSMKKILIFLLAVALGNPTGTTLSEITAILDDFNTSPIVNLIVVYDSASPQFTQLPEVVNAIGEKRKGYFKVHIIDCNTQDEEVAKSFAYCDNPYRQKLPAITFSEPTLNNKDEDGSRLGAAAARQYQGSLSEKSLFNFAVPLMKTYSIELRNSRDFKKFSQKYPETPKIVYFTDKEKIPPFYNALTANFRNTIAFGHVFSKSPLASEMGITSFPIFLLNGKDKIEVNSNLTQMISRLKMIEGEETNIFISEYKNSASIQLTAQNIDELVYKTAEHIFIHVIGSDGAEHPEWEAIQKKFGKMFKYYETSTLKQLLGVKSTPAIVYFPKSLAKKNIQKTVFGARDSLQDIYDEIYSLIEDFTVPISNGLELQKLTGIHFQDGKFVAILFHTKQIPLAYKVVSNDNRLQEDIAFFRMKDPDSQVMEQFQIKKLPALIVMMNDEQESKPTEKQLKEGRRSMNLKLASYTGKFNYDDLFYYFGTFSKNIRNEKVTQQEQQQLSGNAIIEFKKASRFNKMCKDDNCYLLLLNGASENKNRNEESLQILQKQSSKLFGSNFGFIDAVCHSEIANAFEVMEEDLPVLIYINSKFEKFARLIGRLEEKSIASFFAKVKSNRAAYRGYDKAVFENKDCEFEHEKLKQMSEKSAQISPEEADILNELREEEEKKREEFEEAKKADKVRKKGRKKRPQKDYEQDL